MITNDEGDKKKITKIFDELQVFYIYFILDF